MQSLLFRAAALAVLLTAVASRFGADAAAPPGDRKRDPREVAALIDREIGTVLAREKLAVAPRSDDTEFLRRACLDLTGRIPTVDLVRAFLADGRPDKRGRLVDELLATPEFGRHLARGWARLVTAEEPAQAPAVEKWLAEQLTKNRGWGETVSAMLTATGKAPETGFVLSNVESRVPQPNKLAGSAARLFLGVQLQCAECHKHPFSEWTQDDFWGLAAFFGRTRFQPKGTPAGVVEGPAPTAKGKAAPKGAVIVIPTTAGKAAGKAVAARFPGGARPELGDEGPYRPALAAWLTARDNPYFARAAVNRAWWQLFGRGLVNPVDDLHDGNPPTHPELLRLLAEEFAGSGFDLRHLLRCICSSEAYQRTSRGNADEERYARMAVKVMSPDTLYDSLCVALGVKDLKVADAIGLGSGRGGSRSVGRQTGRDRFLKAFTTQDPETTPVEFTHGIPQALSLLNEPQFNAGGPVIDALVKAGSSPGEVVEGLFLATLSRRPTDAERGKLTAHVERRADKKKGYADVFWVLINTTEFPLIP